jgi:hypothetical protein
LKYDDLLKAQAAKHFDASLKMSEIRGYSHFQNSFQHQFD